MPHNLTLQVIPDRFAVCKLPSNAGIPAAILTEPCFSITRTPDELSLVVREERIQPGGQTEPGWRMLKVLGPLDFALVGVLAQLAGILSQAEISIFVTSTFDTDYVLVKSAALEQAVQALRAAGMDVIWDE